ncbi:MAG: hypothetical protein ABS81_06075 [Pseudonocardia sp. SCN 72-86]|nr:MAG: hypothetical protein ABS81_06075 [Pseudonocardia sp. SCN 72-86]
MTEDRHRKFVRFEGLRAEGTEEDAVLSLPAFELHGHGMRNSIADGDPGFVSDSYLNAVNAKTTVTAAELCTAGLWLRVDDGYEILDPEMVQMTLESYILVRRLGQCEAVLGGHRRASADPGKCGHCGCWIDPPDDDED